MSDATALERSALERKERDELVTIAQALGGKPAARAAKATIINLILELTGVSGGDEAAPAPAKATRARKAAAAPEPADDEADADDAVEAVEAPAEEAEAGDDDADDAADDDEDDAAEAPADEHPAARQDQQPRQNGGQNGAQGRNHNQGGGQQPGQNGNQNQQQGQGQPGQGGDGQGDDDEEGGNRRRRRRGRNRGGEPGGAPGGQPDEWVGDPVDVEGVVDLRDEGYGFLRVSGFLPSRDDAYISVKQARQFGLRRGDLLAGASRPALRNEKNPALLRIDTVNGVDADQSRGRRRFDSLTPVFPDSRLALETAGASEDPTARIIDLVAPIGKGQRGLITAAPGAGKTSVVKQVVRSIEANHPDVHLFVVLVDERPEEVTDMRRWLANESSTVVATTFERPADEHTQVAELVGERAKRLVEDGADVVVVLDGLTRLARAYNLAAQAAGRVTSGELDAGALLPLKRLLASARNAEEGGSLTILATALVETGSRLDEAIFEELGGTANLELRLDRRLADRRVHPAIDVDASSTRHEDLLLGADLPQVAKLRAALQDAAQEGGPSAGLGLLLDRLQAAPTNQALLAEIAKAR